jgi:hypothetical protein
MRLWGDDVELLVALDLIDFDDRLLGIPRGADDLIVTAAQISIGRVSMPRAGYADVPGTAHPFMLAHPERVAPLVIDFLGPSA